MGSGYRSVPRGHLALTHRPARLAAFGRADEALWLSVLSCLSHSSISSWNTRLSSLNPNQWWIAFSLNSTLKIVVVYVPQMKFLRDLRPIRCLSLPVDLAQLDPILCFPAPRPAHHWWFTELEEADTLQWPNSLCSWLGCNSKSYMSITGTLAGDMLLCLLLLTSHASAFPLHHLWPFHTCWGEKEE